MAVRDPILFEIIKNAFGTASEEMGMSVVRSAYSTLIKESGDASSAILDGRGNLIAQSIGAPLMHLASIRETAREILKDFPSHTMRDGDVYLMNDQYRGGIHSNDIVVLRPVFIDKQLKFMTSALVHVADLGGIAAGGLPATATEYFHEGLMLPPVRFWQEGVPDETLTRLIQANSRTPVKVMGDLNALIGATGVGANRLNDMAARWGLEEVSASAEELIRYTDLLMRQGIERIPDGRYKGSFRIDDDGIDSSRDYIVRVEVRVAGNKVAVDFNSTDPQARGPINAAYSQAMSGVVYAVRCFLDPSIPMNEGCFTPIEMNLPLGTLVNPRPPAPCNARMATVLASIEAILSALSKAFPEKAAAASGMNHVFTMNASDSSSGVWVFMDNDYGGLGARSRLDGIDAAAPHLMGAHSGSIPVEAVEQEYPVRYQSYRLLDDSGGPGAFRGGLGVERSLRILVDGEITVRSDRMRYPPPGIMRGEAGTSGSYSVNLGSSDEILLPSKKTAVPLNAGDVITERTSGGGGFGNPFERDPQLVLEDVLDHKVSPEMAAQVYGVVVIAETGTVDQKGTARLRQ